MKIFKKREGGWGEREEGGGFMYVRVSKYYEECFHISFRRIKVISGVKGVGSKSHLFSAKTIIADRQLETFQDSKWT